MAGYSDKPVVQKLGIKPGFIFFGVYIFCGRRPAAYSDLVGPLPVEVTLAARLKAPLDMVHVFNIVHVFATEAKGLARKLHKLSRRDQTGRHD